MPLHTKHTPLPMVSSAIYHGVKTSLRVVVLTGDIARIKAVFSKHGQNNTFIYNSPCGGKSQSDSYGPARILTLDGY